MAALALYPEGMLTISSGGVALPRDRRRGVARVEAPRQRGPPEPLAQLCRVFCSLP
jgi:hypothetical protein